MSLLFSRAVTWQWFRGLIYEIIWEYDLPVNRPSFSTHPGESKRCGRQLLQNRRSPEITWGHLGGRWVAFIRFIIAFVRSVNRPSFSIHPCETTNVGVSFSYHLTSPSLGQPSSSDLVICAKFFCQPRYMIIYKGSDAFVRFGVRVCEARSEWYIDGNSFGLKNTTNFAIM